MNCTTSLLGYLDDPSYEGRCENNGYVDTGVVCLNGGSCWNPPSRNSRPSSACLCCYGYSGKMCEIAPTAESISHSHLPTGKITTGPAFKSG